MRRPRQREKYLVRHGIQPDLVLCSTAERASQTWGHVEEAFKVVPPVEYSERLYLASANEIISQLADIPDGVQRLMIVGHNPGLHQLCLKLTKKGAEHLLDMIVLKFPTCAFAAIELGDIAWSELARAQGELTAFVTPKSALGGD